MFSLSLSADVKGLEGQILFDVSGDGQEEMRLNQVGLGIGTIPAANLHVNGNMMVSDKLHIGGESTSANLNLQGSLSIGFQSVSSNTTLSDSSLVLVDSSSDNITLTLPYASNVLGRVYQIKKTSVSNQVEVYGDYIDSATSYSMSSGNMGYIKLMSSGNESWSILNSSSDLVRNWTPKVLTPILWLDASDSSTLTISNGNVTQWSDKSTQGNHAVQNTDDQHPGYDATGFNNLPSISFDGSNEGFVLSDMISLPYNIFAVESGYGYFLSDTGLSGGSGTDRIIPKHTTNDMYWNPSPDLTAVDPSGWRDNTSIQSAFYSLDAAANYVLGINGADQLTGTGTVNVSEFDGLGLQRGAATGVPSWTGDMSEVIIFGSILSTEDRQKVEGYLAWKWDLVDELDPAHPYKSTRP